jgi:6-phosphofructokinase 1
MTDRNGGRDGDRIGIVTGGGDCPGLNAVIRAVVKAASRRGWESLGILGGFEGLLDPMRYRPLDYREMDGMLFRGGTILGTANRGRFAAKTGHGEVRRVPEAALQEARRNFEGLDLRALVCIGGDGSLTIAQQLFETGVPVVGIPKTIDNDLDATIMTFGFETAVSCAVDALDRLHTTAQSHDRVMVLEVMGRYAGWIAGFAGIAGGADVILIPEIPFDYDSIVAKIQEREREGKPFTVVIVAEGARERGGGYVTSDDTAVIGEARLGGIGHVIADQIQRRTGKETRAVVLGHLQRGGSPSAWDRQLCTRFGVFAVELIADGMYGHTVALTPAGIAPVEITDAIDQIRTVPPDGELVRVGNALGVSFGNS